MPSFWSFGESRLEQPALEAQALRQRRFEGHIHRLLVHAREGSDIEAISFAASIVSSSTRSAARRARRGRSVGLGTSIMPPGQDHVHGLGFSDRAGQALRAAKPGMTPSLISGWPNFAVSEAMMISQIIASSQPPPSA